MFLGHTLAPQVVRTARSNPYGEPITLTIMAIGAIAGVTKSIIDAKAAAKAEEEAAITAAGADNPCIQRTQAALKALGARPVIALSERARNEKIQYDELTLELQRLLKDPMACPEVRESIRATQEAARLTASQVAEAEALAKAQQQAQMQAVQQMFIIGGVGAVGVLGLVAILMVTKKPKKKKKPAVGVPSTVAP